MKQTAETDPKDNLPASPDQPEPADPPDQLDQSLLTARKVNRKQCLALWESGRSLLASHPLVHLPVAELALAAGLKWPPRYGRATIADYLQRDVMTLAMERSFGAGCRATLFHCIATLEDPKATAELTEHVESLRQQSAAIVAAMVAIEQAPTKTDGDRAIDGLARLLVDYALRLRPLHANRDRKLLEARLGVVSGARATLASVASETALTRERIRQIMVSYGKALAVRHPAWPDLVKRLCRRQELPLGQWTRLCAIARLLGIRPHGRPRKMTRVEAIRRWTARRGIRVDYQKRPPSPMRLEDACAEMTAIAGYQIAAGTVRKALADRIVLHGGREYLYAPHYGDQMHRLILLAGRPLSASELAKEVGRVRWEVLRIVEVDPRFVALGDRLFDIRPLHDAAPQGK